MKILIFTEGTIIMHPSLTGLNREDRVKKTEENIKAKKTKAVDYFENHIPIGDAVQKLQNWNDHGAEILYLSSRTTKKQINDIQNVLNKHNFPKGRLLFRIKDESYKDIAEREIPDLLIEDDCEGSGGTPDMVYTHTSSKMKKRIKSIAIKEFEGIDHLEDDLSN